MINLTPELEAIKFKLSKPSWIRQVRMIAKFHHGCVKLFGQAHARRPREGETNGWGLKESAEQLNVSIFVVRQAVVLNRALEDHPELSKIDDKTEAWRIVND